MHAGVVQDLVWESRVRCGWLSRPTDNLPATQLPTPALKDWSSSSAFIGHDLLSTPLLNSSRSGMDMIGSKPSAEIGGSAKGDLHRRIRPSLRGSRKATWAASSSPFPLRCKTNCRHVRTQETDGTTCEMHADLHEPWWPVSRCFSRCFSVVHRQTAFNLWARLEHAINCRSSSSAPAACQSCQSA